MNCDNKKLVNIIIVDFNSMEKTIQYIESLINKIVGVELCFTIVDNSENQTSFSYLKHNYLFEDEFKLNSMIVCRFNVIGNDIIYIYGGGNLGYAKGNNLGFCISKTYYDFSYFIISNNDLIVPEQYDISHYIDIFEADDEIAVIGPGIIGLSNENQSPYKERNIWQAIIFYGILWPLVKISKKIFLFFSKIDSNTDSHKCYWVQGSFMCLRSDYFEQIDKFDGNTFLYCEEMILAERLKKIEKCMYYDNKYSLIHNHGESTKKNFDFFRRERMNFESEMYYYSTYKNINTLEKVLAKIGFKLYIFKKKLQFWIENGK